MNLYQSQMPMYTQNMPTFYPNAPMPQPQQQQNMYNGLIWVHGFNEANMYQLAPGSGTVLLDCDNDGVFYIKTRDKYGIYNIMTFNYTEVAQNNVAVPQNDMSEYVKREEFDELKRMIEERGVKRNGKQTVSTDDGTGTKPSDSGN